MRKPIHKATFVALLLILFGWAIYPPERQLRLGKDLRGGVSLIYSVQIDPGEDASEIMRQTIDVLRERVDPDGLMEITMVAQGRDRLEVTMPLPGRRVTELRRQFEDKLNQLATTRLTDRVIRELSQAEQSDRDARIERMAGGSEDRARLIHRVVEAYIDFQEASAVYEDAAGEGASQEVLDDLVDRAAEAGIAYEEAREEARAGLLSPDEVRRALDRSNREQVLTDRAQGRRVVRPSPRELALDRLREEYPATVDLLDEIVAAFEAYEAQRTTLDDPSDLMRLLQASGELSFRITVDARGTGGATHPDTEELRARFREDGPRRAGTRDARWFRINQIDSWYDDVQSLEALLADPGRYFAAYGQAGYVVEEWDGEYYMLCWDRPNWRLTQRDDNIGAWQVSRAYEGVDQVGRPAINFEMDPRGASALGRLTGEHVQNRMAVLLDDQVYTAPTLQSRISRRGQITGDFAPEDRRYIIRVLSAGTLQARLSEAPISQSTIGPELGADNLRAGMIAGIWALAVVSVFMVVYYFRCGLIAVFALGCNAVIILGFMALNQAAFTLPGIAGIILTFGIAVDANVLIFERIREELRRGAELKHAVRLGYQRALSAIVDGNVTNLIVCLVLAQIGTQEIRGFAITLGIGVVATLFSALVISRLIFSIFVDEFGLWRRMRMLPTVIPVIERALEPSVKWMNLRWVFVVVSVVFVGIGVFMVNHQGAEMLDNEFRGGTMVTLQFKRDEDTGERITMTRREVEERVERIAGEDVRLQDLRAAQILPLNPEADGVTSNQFRVRTLVTDGEAVVQALTSAFLDVVDSRSPLRFADMESPERTVFPIQGRSLVDTLRDERPDLVGSLPVDTTDHVGGVAIILDDIEPRATLEGLNERIAQMRQQPEFAESLLRNWTVEVLRGDDDSVRTAVLIVSDDAINFFDDEQAWEAELAGAEWDLVRQALTRTTTLAEVQNFSPAIAATFQARAIVAVALSFLLILIYIWVRFGTVRYSVAAIITLMHDVLIVIGLIALAEIVHDNPVTQPIAQSLGIMPFKIDLNMIAAILTIIGYSLNDTIVIMDRIRENRGKLDYTSEKVINDSINQTISRTVITSGTTLLAIGILYIFGGTGVRAFAYALMIGVIVGTYSSIAVAGPLVWSRKKDRSLRRAREGTLEPLPVSGSGEGEGPASGGRKPGSPSPIPGK